MRASNGRYERFMISNEIGDLHLGLFLYKAKDKYIYIAQKRRAKGKTSHLNHLTDNKGQVVDNSQGQVVHNSKDQIMHHSKGQIGHNNKGQIIYHRQSQVLHNNKGQIVHHGQTQVLDNSKGQVLRNSKGQVLDNSKDQMVHQRKDQMGHNNKIRHFCHQRGSRVMSNHRHLVHNNHSRYCLYFTEVKMKLYVEILNDNLYFTFVYFYLGNCCSSKT